MAILGSVVNRYVPHQKKYNWEVMLPMVEASARGAGSAGVGGLAKDLVSSVTGVALAEAVSALIIGVEFGGYKLGADAVMNYGHRQKKVPGRLEDSVLSLTFRETELGLVDTYFNMWRNLVVDEDGLYGVRLEYSKTVVLMLLSSVGFPVKSFDYREVYPKTISSGTLDYDESAILAYTIEFAVSDSRLPKLGVPSVGEAVGALL